MIAPHSTGILGTTYSGKAFLSIKEIAIVGRASR
jgi:hypothetical protein